MTSIMPNSPDPRRVLAVYAAFMWILVGLVLSAGCLPTHNHSRQDINVAPISTQRWF